MRSGAWGGVMAILFGASALASCSAGGGANELGPNCPSDQKLCDGKCVSRTDVKWGCGDDECYPCKVPGAEATCGPKGECTIKSCLDGFLNCNKSAQDGCEERVSTENCGGCYMACPEGAPNTRGANCTSEATGGPLHCGIDCQAGYVDADSDPTNGCEKALLLSNDVRCDAYPPENKSACGLLAGVECAYSSPDSDCIETFDCIGNGTAAYWQLQGKPCP